MKCIFCNTDIPDGAPFCKYCGTKQIISSQENSNISANDDHQFSQSNSYIEPKQNNQITTPQPSTSNVAPSITPPENQYLGATNISTKPIKNPKNNSMNTKAIIFVAAGILIVIIVGVLAYIAGSRKNSNNISTSNSSTVQEKISEESNNVKDDDDNDSTTDGNNNNVTSDTTEEIVSTESNTVKETTEENTTEVIITEEASQETEPDIQDGIVADGTTPFYGVWCFGSKSEDEAVEFANQMQKKGFNANVLATTDWENLNSELYYVVTADFCKTEDDANQLLKEVQDAGYSDAYVKYTGNKY